jgi:hypothetical protein
MRALSTHCPPPCRVPPPSLVPFLTHISCPSPPQQIPLNKQIQKIYMYDWSAVPLRTIVRRYVDAGVVEYENHEEVPKAWIDKNRGSKFGKFPQVRRRRRGERGEGRGGRGGGGDQLNGSARSPTSSSLSAHRLLS